MARRLGLRRLLAIAVFAAASAAHGEGAWHVQVDNDFFFNTDRWYSSGVRIGREIDSTWEVGVLHEVFSPDAKHWKPGTADRIPVGRMLAFGARHAREAEAFETIELAAGVRGPTALGRQLTTALHHVFAAATIDWSRQLENRVDVQAAFARSQPTPVANLKAHYGLVAGNQLAFAHGGLEYRFGANAGEASGLLRFASTPPAAGATPGWGGYVGASARLVARNELIGRNYDPYGPQLSRERAVGRFVAGAAWSQPWGTIDVSLAQETHEFVGQAEPHRFGSIALRIAF